MESATMPRSCIFWTRLTVGAAHSAGQHQADSLVLVIVTRRSGYWWVEPAQNVMLADPRNGCALLRVF